MMSWCAPEQCAGNPCFGSSIEYCMGMLHGYVIWKVLEFVNVTQDAYVYTGTCLVEATHTSASFFKIK